jgi:hypothetical protein
VCGDPARAPALTEEPVRTAIERQLPFGTPGRTRLRFLEPDAVLGARGAASLVLARQTRLRARGHADRAGR